MSEEREYLELTLRLPGVVMGDMLKERGEVICDLLSKSEFSDDFVNNDIIVNYDTQNELYIALSTDVMDNSNLGELYTILLAGFGLII